MMRSHEGIISACDRPLCTAMGRQCGGGLCQQRLLCTAGRQAMKNLAIKLSSRSKNHLHKVSPHRLSGVRWGQMRIRVGHAGAWSLLAGRQVKEDTTRQEGTTQNQTNPHKHTCKTAQGSGRASTDSHQWPREAPRVVLSRASCPPMHLNPKGASCP